MTMPDVTLPPQPLLVRVLRPNKLQRWLAARIFNRIVPDRLPDFVIGGAEDPYMLRWWLIPRNRWANVYLHCVLDDDDDRALHDHPWPSLSLMLRGELGEVYLDRKGLERRRIMRRGSLVWRRATFTHRLYLPRNPDRPRHAWTLFLTGPVIREWGFLCPKGWRHWREFTAARDGKSGEIGRGCE